MRSLLEIVQRFEDAVEHVLIGHVHLHRVAIRLDPIPALTAVRVREITTAVLARAEVMQGAGLEVVGDGGRRVTAIGEIAGLGRGNKYRVFPVFEFRASGRDSNGNILGRLEPTGRRSRRSSRLPRSPKQRS